MSRASVRQAVMMLVAVLFCGFALGVILSDHIEELPLPFTESDRDYDDDLEDVIDAEQKLLRGMGLSAAQQNRIDTLLDQREDTLVAFWSSHIPAMNQIIDSSRARIRATLTTAQQRRYDTGIAELLRRRDD
jgi:hypothetical protein